MKLIQDILQNRNLSFVDAKSENEFTLNEILFDLKTIESKNKQLVFLYCKNQIEDIGLYFSFLKSNFTIALLNRELNIELKQNLEKTYSPNVIFDDSRDGIEAYNRIQIQSDAQKLTSTLFYNSNVQTAIHANVKLLLSTSGTTGSPKFVKLSEENIYQNTLSISSYLPIISEDVTPLNLPIFYSYGLSVLQTNALKGGTIVCNTDDILSRTFWKQWDVYKFTSFAGVPFVYQMLERIGFLKKTYSSLRYFSQAGGNLNVKTKERFLNYGLENDYSFYVMYGQTEATARISYVEPKALQNNLTTIGTPILNGVLEIDKETEELLYKGPNIFGGYAKQASDLENWEDIQTLHTGDLAYKDKQGFFFIKGRMKRFVKLFGNRINLDEIERLIKQKLNGITCASIGFQDKHLIIFLEKPEFDTAEIHQFLTKEIKIHTSTIKYRFIEELPLNANGKMDYNQLTRLYDKP
ncbi:MAG: AMP-binding protein [Flavobacteriales bacterium]